ncbi:hypothetical protein [Sphingobium sp. YR657]|uniref:hypothetical protein n=1 Tax=Sphingobium sp. YR657 TaxID=1884366 RepID=UPI0031381E6E
MALSGMFAKTPFELIGADGAIKGRGLAQFDSAKIFIYDAMLPILVGDEIRRRLPNGVDEAFEVLDPVFYDNSGLIAPHFEVAVRRKGTFDHHKGGNLSIAFTGDNARVNVGSADNSINIVNKDNVFGNLTDAIDKGVSAVDHKAILIEAVKEMENAKGSSSFAAAYQKFVGLTADHIGVVAPFLAPLAAMIGG